MLDYGFAAGSQGGIDLRPHIFRNAAGSMFDITYTANDGVHLYRYYLDTGSGDDYSVPGSSQDAVQATAAFDLYDHAHVLWEENDEIYENVGTVYHPYQMHWNSDGPTQLSSGMSSSFYHRNPTIAANGDGTQFLLAWEGKEQEEYLLKSKDGFPSIVLVNKYPIYVKQWSTAGWSSSTKLLHGESNANNPVLTFRHPSNGSNTVGALSYNIGNKTYLRKLTDTGWQSPLYLGPGRYPSLTADADNFTVMATATDDPVNVLQGYQVPISEQSLGKQAEHALVSDYWREATIGFSNSRITGTVRVEIRNARKVVAGHSANYQYTPINAADSLNLTQWFSFTPYTTSSATDSIVADVLITTRNFQLGTSGTHLPNLPLVRVWVHRDGSKELIDMVKIRDLPASPDTIQAMYIPVRFAENGPAGRQLSLSVESLEAGSHVSYELTEVYDFTDTSASAHGQSIPVTGNPPVSTGITGTFPNPFNPATTIRYTLQDAQHVRVSVYDITGRKVTTLVNKRQNAGYHTAVWNAYDTSDYRPASGMYFLVLDTRGKRFTKKVILLQ